MVKRLLISIMAFALFATQAYAQLSTNKDKFLGNITTTWSSDMDFEGFIFSDYWNQVTPENATKWESVEGTRGSYNWWGSDKAATYAAQKGIPFKFHTLVWGSQFPGWLRDISPEERYQAIVKWMDAVKAHYPNLPIIDVVNEAIEGHQRETYLMIEALGGKGVTGYDWIIRAFEMAAERWPDAILVYNDFNSLQYDVPQFVDLVCTLRDAGAPIDAYGCQAHELYGCSKATLQYSMSFTQNVLKMPMYITEYDIGTQSDSEQLKYYKEHIPTMWEADYCAGVTLWGWFYGHTWTNDGAGYSGLIRDGKERSALTWLRQYMQTAAAKNAKSPFPGMVKEASVYVKPSALLVTQNTPVSIEVKARLRTKTISRIDLYVGNTLLQSFTQQPYTCSFTPEVSGRYELRAVVTATDGSTYERFSGVNVSDEFIPQPGVTAAVGKRYVSVSEIGTRTFAIVNEQDGKAIYGSGEQNLGYDNFATAFTNEAAGYYFRLESLKNDADPAVRNYYRLRLIDPKGYEYNIWGKPGYLNSQPVETGWCSFILGLTAGNGEDMKNGAVWDVQYVDGKGFTLRNIGTGLYLHDASPAKYEEPAYFTFCSLKAATTGVKRVSGVGKDATAAGDAAVYNLQGMKVGNAAHLDLLPRGIYLIGGRKVAVE